ncbi:hypothetical protein [Streptococcus equi]|uniref:hypothetical protein n=1 Tax=Streptococcus equi TaxID=1336 RepID=UPI001E3051C3|nr:hypothetical protein [Streptococcus equi]
MLIDNIKSNKVLANPSFITRICQNVHYFDMTLRDNITMGVSNISDEQLSLVLEKFGLLHELGTNVWIEIIKINCRVDKNKELLL